MNSRLLLATTLLLCGSGHAQVRPCQVEGHPASRSDPCARPARVAAAAAAEPVAAPKKKTLAELLRERDGADRGRPHPPEFPTDGAIVLRNRMGAV